MKTSIKFKFLIPTVLLIFIAMGASSLISYFQSKDALNSLIIDQITKQADSISIMMESWITERKINVKNWTKEKEFPNAVDTSWVDGFSRRKSSEKLSSFKKDYNSFESINLADNTGLVTSSSDPDLINKYKVDKQSFFQKALKGKMVTSLIFKSNKTGQPVFAIAAPILLSDEITGVIFAIIDFTSFSDKFITPVKIGRKGFAFVTDSKGVAIAYPDKNQIFRLNLAKLDIWASLKDKKSGLVNIKLDNKKCVVAFKKLKDPFIYISAAADSDEIFSPVTLLAKVSAATVAISIIIAVLIILFIANSVLKPLKEVVTNLKDAAEGNGDLTTRIEVSSVDEIGELAESFNIFIGKIQSIIKDLAQNSYDLTSSAKNLADISIEMNNSSDHTSGISANVASSSDDMKGNISLVAEVLDTTSNNINTVAAAADQMSATINEIASNTGNASQITQSAVGRAKEVTKQMSELGNSASQINHVIGTITDISEQVNLLALNATIEAARAGESGKGFAVVANEIKDLARQTADATDEIRSKIEAIQASTTNTISGIKNITNTVNETNDIVITIASAIEEQSSARKLQEIFPRYLQA
ncbi:MAG: methyl-accepting chemotaxis protein [Deltaproteobacteria bacterium]|nr:methyl-accepting chemotaxis protein [Deltaproteobacteria bacterium]